MIMMDILYKYKTHKGCLQESGGAARRQELPGQRDRGGLQDGGDQELRGMIVKLKKRICIRNCCAEVQSHKKTEIILFTHVQLFVFTLVIFADFFCSLNKYVHMTPMQNLLCFSKNSKD